MFRTCGECQRLWRDYADAANAYVKIVRRRHIASIQRNSATLKVLAPIETEAAQDCRNARNAVEDHEATHLTANAAATGEAVLTS
jgi:hypothetical protein